MSADRQEQSYHESAVTYLDSLKNYLGRVMELDWILELKKGITFGEFLESIRKIGTYTDDYGYYTYMDHDWYEEGKYTSGALNPEFHQSLQKHLRNRGILSPDQTLNAFCHYSSDPNHDLRAQLIIDVSSDKGNQFVPIYIEGDFEPFDFRKDRSAIKEMRVVASQVGRPEISAEDYQEYVTKLFTTE